MVELEDLSVLASVVEHLTDVWTQVQSSALDEKETENVPLVNCLILKVT